VADDGAPLSGAVAGAPVAGVPVAGVVAGVWEVGVLDGRAVEDGAEVGAELGAVVVLGDVGRLDDVVGAVLLGDVGLGEVLTVVGCDEVLCDGGVEVAGSVRLVVPASVGSVLGAVVVAPRFGVLDVAPVGGSISVVGGRVGSLPLSRTTASTAAAVAIIATTPAASALFRARSASARLASARLTGAASTGSSGLVPSAPTGTAAASVAAPAAPPAAAPAGAMPGAMPGGTTGTTPWPSPGDSARSEPAAISAADGRSAGSLASIRTSTLSKGPASSGRSRLGRTAGASTCW
jgi:hypothetical protein